MKSKKGVEVSPLSLIIGMLLLGVVAVVVLNIVIKGTGDAALSLSPVQMQAKNKLCQLRGGQIEKLREPIEVTPDGYPDDCDICLGGRNDLPSSNSYGIPDECYVDPSREEKIKTYKDMCIRKKGCYISETNQCCLSTDVNSKECGLPPKKCVNS